MGEKALAPKRQRFVDEYPIDLNATKAAIRAGYSKKGARVRGAELLANRNISAAVEKAIAERASTAGYKPSASHASRLAANGSVQARVVSVYDGDTLTVDAGRLTTKDHIRRKLSDVLIAENLGRPYRGGRRKGWCP